MRRRTTQRLLACLAVAAYVVAGSGIANQLVYCIGADGHSAIEKAHTAAACKDSRQASSSTSVAASDSCTDLPLLVQASKEGERLNQVNPDFYPAATTFVPGGPTAAPPTRAKSAVAFILQDTASLRTTVLRV